MLHPALVNYKNLVPCRPEDVESLRRTRIADENRLLRADKLRRRNARLVCADCGDRHKILVQRRWVCRHCMAPMVDPLAV